MHGPARTSTGTAGVRGDTPAGSAAVDPFDTPDDVPRLGTEFYAGYDSECSAADCIFGADIEEGDLIQADGEGGWVHQECADA